MRNYSSHDIVPMLNGKYRDRYLYPRVQVKVINENIFIVGIGDGVDAVLQLIDNIKRLDFGNITFEIVDKIIDKNEKVFQYREKPFNYQFITPWAALNKNAWKDFKRIDSENRINYLNKLLEKNLAFISNELKLTKPNKLLSMVKVASIDPVSIDNKWGSFEGLFKTNFDLPSFIGLGNGITRGFGTIFNEKAYQSFNKDDLELQNLDEKTCFESEFDEIHAEDFDKLNAKKNKKNHQLKRRKRKQPKNVNNDGYNNDHNKDSEPNFNTELYHQKQHKV